MASLAHVLETPSATPTPIFELPLAEIGDISGNRRFLPRVAYPFSVRLGETGDVLDGIDLSFGGLMCSGDTLIWPGNLVTLDLMLPGESKPVELMGRVVALVSHRGETAMRMRFEDASASARKRIAHWMATQADL